MSGIVQLGCPQFFGSAHAGVSIGWAVKTTNTRRLPRPIALDSTYRLTDILVNQAWPRFARAQ
jgi:hypothetical protein